ncbi:MAG: CoB--CoM heterodisulfide reductase subunit B, partial [Candidatus Methanoperedens sp.]|nr:CoB--CoM heterodisulfide reductase subunit B [Candidatus Methanoperedens sp.]
STLQILRNFGIEIVDIPGASCCPAPGVFGSFDLKTWLALAARNLCLAEQTGSDIMTMCNGCYGSLQEANHLLKENRVLREKINSILSPTEFKGTINVKHQVEIFTDDIGLERIKESMKKPLDGLRVAVHYGCHFLKPTEVRGHGSAERPKILDALVEITGAKSIEYRDKMMCCGFGGGVRARDVEVALDITREKLTNMIDAGADCVVNACASCHLEFDRGQTEIQHAFGDEFALPVLYYTQLLGLALGITPHDLGMLRQNIPVDPVLNKIGGNK